MVTVDEMQRLVFGGADVVGADGKKIGSLGQLFLDAATGEPAWVSVATGLLGRGRSFVPLGGAVVRGDVLEVPHDKDRVRSAPGPDDDDGALSPEEELTLRRHYGLAPDEAPAELVGEVPWELADEPGRGDASRDTTEAEGATGFATTSGAEPGDAEPSDAGPSDAGPRPGDDDEDALTLRAERAKVIGTERVPTERVRLRRYTVTEERTVTVPVRREEFRIEYEPTDAGSEPEPAGAGYEAGSDAGARDAGASRTDGDADAARDDHGGPGPVEREDGPRHRR